MTSVFRRYMAEYILTQILDIISSQMLRYIRKCIRIIIFTLDR